MIASGLQGGQDRLNVLLDEKHCDQNHVAGRDVVEAFIQKLGVLPPFGRGVQRDAKPRQLARQHLVGARHRARQMAIQRHNDEAHGSAASG